MKPTNDKSESFAELRARSRATNQDMPRRFASGGAVRGYANGGPTYLFEQPGSHLTAPGSTPGGAGLVPAMQFRRNTFQAAPKGTPAPPNSGGNILDKYDQAKAAYGDAKSAYGDIVRWLTPSSAPLPQVSQDTSVPDPRVIDGGPYRRGGVVAKKRGAASAKRVGRTKGKR